MKRPFLFRRQFLVGHCGGNNIAIVVPTRLEIHSVRESKTMARPPPRGDSVNVAGSWWWWW